MQIEQQVIDEVIRHSEIVEVMGKSLTLKRSGGNYFACCPFHNEKTPSLSINSKEQFFHCFGCGESGNVITFVMNYFGLDFVEAIKKLARDCGVHIPESNKKISREEILSQKKHKATLNDTINQVVKSYKANLNNMPNAVNYLKKRGLSAEISQNFLLGYALDDFNGLAQTFPDYAKNQFLLDAGLVVKNDSGKLYDRFRNRIMFPIRNTHGDVIAFGGRVISNSEPKYLNSPETALFNKSHELYGLFEGQKSIREQKHAIVVEGYMDVIALFQFGVTNVVASMGTAATEDHIKKLFRLCEDIYYCFDGDNAGRKAAWRALERSMPLVTDLKAVHFSFLPQGEDPDSFIRKFGTDEFTNQIKNKSMSLSAYLMAELSQSVNINTEEGKAKLISLAKPYLENTKAIALQVMLKKQLANLVQLEPNVLESILNNRSRYAFYNSRWNKNQLPVQAEKISKATFNNIKTVVLGAIEHIDWVHNSPLPEEIANYSIEIRELILFLDFISHNYNVNEKIDILNINENIEFNALNITQILNNKIPISNSTKSMIDIQTEQKFKDALKNLFRFEKITRIKNPKITMKNTA
ncbi:MAG: DNA primase [Proteobacteria bacterium]|jgi:DNA primase|nr:DNA primase [Pseudomonadota bacterium]